jgi:two-component system LytT family response regulator
MQQNAMRAIAADQQQPAPRFVIKNGERVTLVSADEIWWIEAAGNYLRLHVANGRSHLLRETMKGIEASLDAGTFQRIQRSAIVNLTRVQRIEPWTRGECVVILHDGTRLTTAGGFGRQLRAVLTPRLTAHAAT